MQLRMFWCPHYLVRLSWAPYEFSLENPTIMSKTRLFTRQMVTGVLTTYLVSFPRIFSSLASTHSQVFSSYPNSRLTDQATHQARIKPLSSRLLQNKTSTNFYKPKKSSKLLFLLFINIPRAYYVIKEIPHGIPQQESHWEGKLTSFEKILIKSSVPKLVNAKHSFLVKATRITMLIERALAGQYVLNIQPLPPPPSPR